ncbi:unnamed protein product [Heligmosomoides polygyrus]|uniref:Secreted protein n=1 Tax=Heligmosomoides polygyrus TaxID=6339 RepID=A0A183FXV0_HELPZ|nr:unnamed protein product [Heligmosomoides polygyrus]
MRCYDDDSVLHLMMAMIQMVIAISILTCLTLFRRSTLSGREATLAWLGGWLGRVLSDADADSGPDQCQLLSIKRNTALKASTTTL